ncbi:MAG: malonyl-CoA decarboxylase [Alphaproteobacteria bacterium]|nr:malonyl-CoA decarboxylase [Alphaproteobacteria bacterium]MDP6567581.1 malonyl-CoA decarboxylase [Alphaproteobacteria bacterium]MDP6814207.1 malonyl-CoA decarboxylase [Alphaproteobacteria bacterium]
MLDRESFFDRTLAPLRRALFGGAGERTAAGELSDSGVEKLKERIEACLDQRGGEVSSRARAAELGHLYLGLGAEARQRFLRLLAEDYGIDRPRVDTAITALQGAKTADEERRAERNLRATLVPRRFNLLTQFNALPQGVKFLVDLRADLLPLAREDQVLAALDGDLRELLRSWFDIGFLDLRRITWDESAALLEKLMAYEAVHEIRSWDDLRNRLDSDRRCFAFFHPRMPDEPLIFVEVALVSGMADNVQVLLDEHAPEGDPRRADSAIFYSISNAQAGLAGISFGDFLIKRVVDELRGELPNLKTFATLSPLPGFRRWLQTLLEADGDRPWGETEERRLVEAAGIDGGAAALRALLARADWYQDQGAQDALQPVLTSLAARYLLHGRRGQRALDPVAHFHLSNGARLERVNWLGDTSPNGLEQSAGLMVNYLYKLGDIEQNHEAYRGRGKISASAQVRRLLKG